MMIVIATAAGAMACASPPPAGAPAVESVPPDIFGGEEIETEQPDPRVATEAIAMPEDEFWALIALLDGTADGATTPAVHEAIASGGIDAVLAFDARLTLLLHALDGRDIAESLEPVDPGWGFSPDGLLYARGWVLLQGRSAYQTVASSRDLLDVMTGDEDEYWYGEGVLYLALDSAALLGMSAEDYWDLSFERIPLSYETGENVAAW